MLAGRRACAAQRWSLWGSLSALVAALLVTLVWLAGRYEASQVQSQARARRRRGRWRTSARRSRATCRRCRRCRRAARRRAAWTARGAAPAARAPRDGCASNGATPSWAPLARRDTPYRPPVFARLGRANAQPEVALACANARRMQRPGLCAELLRAAGRRPGPGGDGAVPAAGERRPAHAATWWPPIRWARCWPSLVGPQLTRSQEVSFTEADGTRLALHGIGAARHAACSPRSSCWTCRATRWCCAWTAGAARPTCSRTCSRRWSRRCRSRWSSVLFLLGKDTRRRLRGGARPGRRAGLSQGDGGLAGHRPARARPAGPHHLRQPGVLRRWWASRAEELLGHATPGALLAAGAGGRIPEAPGGAAGGPARAAARGLRVGLHAQGRLALSGADHRGAADQRARACRPAG